MTIVVNHSTPADGSFSSTGAAAWNANHTLSGVGTLAEQNANAVAITGGAINGTTVGATTPASGAFTTLSATTPVPISSGGTAATTSNGAFNKLIGYTVNSGTGTTYTFDNTTAYTQFFTGDNCQVNLPDVTTLPIGYTFHVINQQTTASLLVLDFVGNTTAIVPLNTGMLFTYISAVIPYWVFATTDLWTTKDGLGLGNTGITGTGNLVLQNGSTINNSPSISIVNAGSSGGLTLVRTTGAVTNSTRMFFDSSTSVTSIYNSNGSLLLNTNATPGTSAGANQFRVAPVASAVDYIQVTGSATANPANVTFTAAGTDANINLVLTPKGTGTVKFGTYTAGVVVQAGYITITDSGGTSRRLLVG